MTLRLKFTLATFCLAAVTLLGCGKDAPVGDQYEGATITGTVLENGKPVKFRDNESINLGLYMIEGPGAEKVSFGAPVKPEDGTFTVAGPSGQGIPAGKYKVTLNSEIYGGSGEDRFSGKFASDGSAQMIADVGPNPTQEFTVDLVKRKVLKK